MLSHQLQHRIWRSPARRVLYRLADGLQEVAGLARKPTEEEPYQAPKGPFPVVREEHAPLDEASDIKVSCDLFRPESLSGSLPVVIFCPGLPIGPPDFERAQGVYLCEHLAAHGYLALILQHTDNDARMLAAKPKNRLALATFVSEVIRRVENVPSRCHDLSHVIDVLEKWNREDGALGGHIDCSRIGVFGYCFGGRAALVSMGELWGADRRSYKDERIKAGIVCSFAPQSEPGVPSENLLEIDVPTMTMSGTRDYGWSTQSVPEDRAAPFSAIKAANRYLLMLAGADHVVFSGRRNGKPLRANDLRHHQLIKNVALAFWDAYLKDDEGARRWLDQDFPGLLGRGGKFERK